jgi:hypothetical protein
MCFRFKVEFQWFFTALSVRPGSALAITAGQVLVTRTAANQAVVARRNLNPNREMQRILRKPILATSQKVAVARTLPHR